MLDVTLAHDLDALLDALADSIRAQRAASGRGAFEAATVVAPHLALATAIELGLARRLGIAANVQTTSLARLLVVLAESAPTAGPGGLEARVVDRELTRRLLLDRLEELASADARDVPGELAPVREHLLEAGPAGLEGRRFALATRLAARFVEDAAARPELQAAWRAGASGLPAGASGAGTEVWMRRLWLDTLGPSGVAARATARALEPRALEPALVADLDDGRVEWLAPAEALARAADGVAPALLHVVSLGLEPRAHVDALVALAERGRVHLLALAPSPRAATDETGDRALAAWAGPTAAAARAWVERARAAGGAVAAREGALAASGTRLGRLQRAVVGEVAGPVDAGADASLLLHAAPDGRREVEVAAGEVLAALRAAAGTARPLRLSDVALLLAGPDLDALRARVATVFETSHGLPVSFVDGPGAGEPRVVDAARRVIDLAGGELGLDAVRALLVHGNVGGARAEDQDEVESWVRWVEDLGVVRGHDAADLRGAWPGREHGTWEQALRRLALGALAPEGAAVAVAGDEHLPHAPAAFDAASAGRLVALLRGLLADARAMRDARLTFEAWAGLLAKVVSAWVEPRDDPERETVERVGVALRGLADLDALGDPDRAHPYALAAALAHDALDRAGARRGHELTGGVVCGPLHALRGVPFRVVLVLGLGEDRFPAQEVPADLDLREAGDPAPARARDAGALLDVLLAARERLGLAWSARDPLSGDPLEPSPLVGRLQRELAALGDAPPVLLHPLRRSDAALHAPPLGVRDALAPLALAREHALAPGARAEARARALGEAAARAGVRDLGALRAALGVDPAAGDAVRGGVLARAAAARASSASRSSIATRGADAPVATVRDDARGAGGGARPRARLEAGAPDPDGVDGDATSGARLRARVDEDDDVGATRDGGARARAPIPDDVDGEDAPTAVGAGDATPSPGSGGTRLGAVADVAAHGRLRAARARPGEPAGEARLTLSALHGFLVSPLQAWAEHRLRLRRVQGLEDEGRPGDDVLEPSPLDATVVLREAFVDAVTTGSRKGDPDLSAALARAWGSRARRAVLEHAFPAPPLLGAVAARHEAVLAAWRERLDPWVGLTALRGLVTHGLGASSAGLRAASGAAHPALALDLDLPGGPSRALVVGRTGPVLPGLDRAIALATGSASDAQVARAVLDHAALVAAGLPPPARFEVVVAAAKGRSWRIAVEPFDVDSARAWLTRLASDLLAGPHAYLLPLDPTARWLREQRSAPPAPGDDDALAATIRRAREDPWRGTSDRFGPVQDQDGLAPPRGAAALARARLGPWLSREVSA